MSRRQDRITVEGPGGTFERFESLEIVNDITGPTEARFILGNENAWNALRDVIEPGQEFEVRLNGRPRMKGRAEINVVDIGAAGGTRIELVCRTKLADAYYQSAPADIKIRNATVREAIVAAYTPLGFSDADFVTATFADRKLTTGKGADGSEPVDIDKLTIQQAKVQPPETIYNFVERHLKRFSATHWDSSTGKILIGVPDDTQPPIYRLFSRRGASNVKRVRRIRDWSEVVRDVTAYGRTFGGDITSSSIKATSTDAVVRDVAERTGHFNRSVAVSAQNAESAEHASALARRELSARVRQRDSFEFELDGWSYWNGDEQIPWANNTTVDVDLAQASADSGLYLIVRVILVLSTTGAATTRLTVVAPGIWVI